MSSFIGKTSLHLLQIKDFSSFANTTPSLHLGQARISYFFTFFEKVRRRTGKR